MAVMAGRVGRHRNEVPWPIPRSAVEPRCLLRARGGIPFPIGVCAGPGQAAAVHYQVLLPDGPAFEEALEDLPGPGSVTGLRRERGPRDVGRHPVVGHRAPGMVLWCGLGEPDV